MPAGVRNTPVSTRIRTRANAAANEPSTPAETTPLAARSTTRPARRTTIASGNAVSARMQAVAVGRPGRKGLDRQVQASDGNPAPLDTNNDTMDVNAVPAVRTAPGDKVGQRRKRAPSSVAAAAPDQEGPEDTSSTAGPAKKKTKKDKNAKLRPNAPTAPIAQASGLSAAARLPAPPSKASQRRGALKNINVDEPSSSEDEPIQVEATLDREQLVNEDGEDKDGAAGDDDEQEEEQDDGEVPEPQDEGRLDNLAAEAVSFGEVGESVSESGRSATPVPLAVGTSTAVQSGAEPVVTAKSQRRKRKLEEMPTVSAAKTGKKPKQVVPHGSDAADGSDSDSDSDTDSTSWLARTDISRALKRPSKNTWTVGLNKCRTEIKHVLKGSFEHGMTHIAMGNGVCITDPKKTASMVTPFGSQGIDQIALGALIAAAEDLGYDGANDIAHRLEAGSERRYVAPLRSYTAARLRTYRGELKRAASSAYPSAVHLSTIPRARLPKLLESSSFLYPVLPDGTFMYKQPFNGPGLEDVVRALFFGESQPFKLGTQNLSTFTSSLPSAPHELEIPDAMLAMAATAIHSVLIDRINPATTESDDISDFSGPALHSAYQSYMAILVKLRISALVTYHALMHRICMAVTGGNAVVNQQLNGLPHNAILATVDWDNIAAAATNA